LYDLLFGKEEAINITLVDEDSQTKEAEAEVQAQETAEVQAQETAEVQARETAEVQVQETAEAQAMLSTEKSQQATSQTMDYTKQDSAINAM
ncbi:TPA: hypothetical protein ACIAOS_004218, partial [Salmonella enterica subsp. enterica serovar 16:l,v:-]